MASTSETGHAKNVANFEKLIAFITAYGTTYNPSKTNIKIPGLNTLFTNGKNALLLVKTTKTPFDNAKNARKILFKPIKPFTTRIINALIATDATTETINDAKTINNKIQGKRATPITPTPFTIPPGGTITINNIKLNTPLTNTGTTNISITNPTGQPVLLVTPGTTIKIEKLFIPTAVVHNENQRQEATLTALIKPTTSTSQQSFDLLIDHFTKLLQLLTTEPFYTPNEADLKLTALNTFLNDMKTKNTAVITADTPYSNARISRNTTLYATNTGLVDTANEVKNYVLSIFGARSPQFKQVSKLKFIKIPS